MFVTTTLDITLSTAFARFSRIVNYYCKILVKHIEFCYYYKTLSVTTALKIRYYCINFPLLLHQQNQLLLH